MIEKVKSFQIKSKVIDPSKILPTVGLNVATFTMPPFIIKLWDLGGMINLRPIWKDYYYSSHGVIFIVNTFDRFEERRLEIIDELQRLDADNDVENVPLLIILNYKDKIPDLAYFASSLELTRFVNRPLFLNSANVLKGDGIQECFSLLIKEFKRNIREINSEDFV